MSRGRHARLLPPPLPGPRQGAAYREEPDEGDRDPDPQREAEVEVDLVLVERGLHVVARVPRAQDADAGARQDRVGDHGEDHAAEGADHCPERQHHPEDHHPEIEREGDRGGWQDTGSLLRVVLEWERKDGDGPVQHRPGDGRNADVDGAERESDDGADGEHPPAPGLALGLACHHVPPTRRQFLLLLLGKRQDALRAHRRHRERQLLDVAGQPEQPVAQHHVVEPADHHGEDHQPNGWQPLPHEQRSTFQHGGVTGYDPAGQLLRDAGRARRVGLHEELGPDRPEPSLEVALGHGRRDHDGAREVEQSEDLGAPEVLVGTPRHLDEEDHGDPLGCRPDRHSGDQGHVDGPGHHQHGHEQRAQERSPAEAGLERARRLHLSPKLGELVVGLLPAQAPPSRLLVRFSHRGPPVSACGTAR
jgi:hypothetical protein